MTLTPATIHDYDERAPSGDHTGTATFALGCFWGPDAAFGALEGVVRTRVGYAGGSKPDPTYHALGDHSEALEVEYDPERLGYKDLLALAFRKHDPRTQTAKTQYQNVIFTENSDQRGAVDAFLDASDFPVESVETRVEPLSAFHVAEDYHQKYRLRSHRSHADAFEQAGYDDAALRESPLAAKLNGHAAGHDVPEAVTSILRGRTRSD